MYNYIFGPVVSRRLGLSLGIDLVPMKTCSFDCVYCECGATTELTIERKEYVPTDDVCREIGQFMQNTSQKVDYITFSGSGEPTLHTGIERVIGYIKQNFPKQKIALLTNATLFNDKKVRDGVLDCDLIVPSLDAISPSVFERILGPHPSVTSGTVLEGIISLRKEYTGKLVIELFIVPGENDTVEELTLLRSAIEEISPDALQINYLDRPGTSPLVKKPDEKQLQAVYDFFEGLPVQLVSRPDYLVQTEDGAQLLRQKIVSTVSRRPSTIDDLMVIVGISADKLTELLAGYEQQGLITREKGERGTFYCAVK